MEEILLKFTREGKFLMLAFDHRGSFNKMIDPESPEAIPKADLITRKREIIEALKDQFSGLLVDVEVGLPALDHVTDKPFLLPIEKSGFKDVHGERLTDLEFEAAQLKAMGASGIKLLVYFNPDYESAPGQLQLTREVVHDVMTTDLPSFVEIVTYDKDKPVDPEGEERVDLVLRSLKRFIENGILPDVYKLEYPGSAAACKEVTKICGKIPWIMLTGGQEFEVFKEQLAEAVKAGCQGFLAGRALWKEALSLDGEERKKFLEVELPERFRQICEICVKS